VPLHSRIGGRLPAAFRTLPGAVVPAAQIEVRNSATAVIDIGGTCNTGNYYIPVPAGIYEITVTVPGFKGMCNPKSPATAAGRNAYAKQIGKPKPKGIGNSLHSTRFRPEKTLWKTELAAG
jgi:hypothetical protein